MKIFHKNLSEFSEPPEIKNGPVPPPDGLDQDVLNVVLNNPKKLGILCFLDRQEEPVSYAYIIDTLFEGYEKDGDRSLHELTESGLVTKEQKIASCSHGTIGLVPVYSISDKGKDHVAYKFRDEI